MIETACMAVDSGSQNAFHAMMADGYDEYKFVASDAYNCRVQDACNSVQPCHGTECELMYQCGIFQMGD